VVAGHEFYFFARIKQYSSHPARSFASWIDCGQDGRVTLGSAMLEKRCSAATAPTVVDDVIFQPSRPLFCQLD